MQGIEHGRRNRSDRIPPDYLEKKMAYFLDSFYYYYEALNVKDIKQRKS